MAKNQKKKDEEKGSSVGAQAEKGSKEAPGGLQMDTQDTGQRADQSGDTVASGPAQLRYVGKTIKHFDHQGKIYQLIPNTVYLNLPADAEQVKRLIDNKELIGV